MVSSSTNHTSNIVQTELVVLRNIHVCIYICVYRCVFIYTHTLFLLFYFVLLFLFYFKFFFHVPMTFIGVSFASMCDELLTGAEITQGNDNCLTKAHPGIGDSS